jgi:hypothetical protein
MRSIARIAAPWAFAAVGLTTNLGWAQDGTPPAPPPSLPPPPVAAPVVAPASSRPAEAKDETKDDAKDETTDHARLIGRFGVTYFDITSLPIANPVPDPGTGNAATPAPGAISGSTVAAPVVGIRYWLNDRIGIDGGIGLGLAGGSQSGSVGGTTTNVDKTSTTGAAFHGGVPFAFASGKHYSFLVIPELTVGFTTANFSPNAPPGVMNARTGPSQSLTGFLFDGGVRVGAEIYFGFIGVPQLALSATIGLSFRRSVYSWSSGGNSASDGTNTFGTQVQSDPWAIFKDAISATYYF